MYRHHAYVILCPHPHALGCHGRNAHCFLSPNLFTYVLFIYVLIISRFEYIHGSFHLKSYPKSWISYHHFSQFQVNSGK